jgi:hypothetical protein
MIIAKALVNILKVNPRKRASNNRIRKVLYCRDLDEATERLHSELTEEYGKEGYRIHSLVSLGTDIRSASDNIAPGVTLFDVLSQDDLDRLHNDAPGLWPECKSKVKVRSHFTRDLQNSMAGRSSR